MLALPVEESRAQRQQRLQARFRDRGGIFVPSEKNALIDILLARSVTGESPSKRGRTKQGSSPVREKGKSRALDGEANVDGVQDATALEVAPLVGEKAKRAVKGPRKTTKKLKGKAAKEDHVEAFDNELPVAGPSRLDGPDNGVVTAKGTRQGKAKTKDVPAVPMGDAPKRKGTLPKAKSQPPRDTQAADESDDDDDRRKDESLRPAPKPRGRPPKAKQPSQPSKADVLDDITRIQEAPTKPKKMVKKRRRAADSDQEDGGTSDYMASRKRAKADKVAPAKSAATTTRKSKGVQVTQPDDSDDSSAIVIVAKKKAIKVGSTHKSVDSIKQPVYKADHGDEDKYPLGMKPKARRGAKPQTPERSLYVDDDEDSEATQVDRHPRKGASIKAKSSRVGNGPHVASKSQNRVRSIKPSCRTAVPDSDDEENPSDVPPKRSTKARILPSANLSKVKAEAAAKSSSKRPHDSVDVEEAESDPGELAPPPVRKRAKVAPPASDDETLVETARSKVDASPPAVRKDLPQEMSKSSSRTLKENTITHKSTSQRTNQVQPKSSQAKTRKDPPQEVLNRIKTRPPPSSPHAGSDTDPIDFLS